MTQSAGMEDVVAAESAITWIDGRRGELRYRGYAIGELAEGKSFEEVAFLLWHGELPPESELSELTERLRAARLVCKPLMTYLSEVTSGGHPLDVLRYLVSADALRNPLTWNNSSEANDSKAVQFTAWFPVAIAALHRLRRGLEPVAPRADLDTAANFLYMLHGCKASPVEVDALNTSLILHADHELNASTFAARVTIATQSNLHAAIVSALGTLSGPRHGGASEHVIKMLDEIGSPDRVEDYVQRELTAKRRIMGYGHRVYRTTDPRSRHLRAMAVKMLQGTPHESWIAALDVLSEVMERRKGLFPNVDLYAALVNHGLGISPEFYTSVFALSRIVGWTAHSIEQLHGRMIRPVAAYVGPAPRSATPQTVVPVG